MKQAMSSLVFLPGFAFTVGFAIRPASLFPSSGEIGDDWRFVLQLSTLVLLSFMILRWLARVKKLCLIADSIITALLESVLNTTVLF